MIDTSGMTGTERRYFEAVNRAERETERQRDMIERSIHDEEVQYAYDHPRSPRYYMRFFGINVEEDN